MKFRLESPFATRPDSNKCCRGAFGSCPLSMATLDLTLVSQSQIPSSLTFSLVKIIEKGLGKEGNVPLSSRTSEVLTTDSGGNCVDATWQVMARFRVSPNTTTTATTTATTTTTTDYVLSNQYNCTSTTHIAAVALFSPQTLCYTASFSYCEAT